MKILKTVLRGRLKVKFFLIISENIDIKVDDYPHEIEDRKNKLMRYEKSRKLLQIKDDIIWNLITNKKERFEADISLTRDKHQNELNDQIK